MRSNDNYTENTDSYNPFDDLVFEIKQERIAMSKDILTKAKARKLANLHPAFVSCGPDHVPRPHARSTLK